MMGSREERRESGGTRDVLAGNDGSCEQGMQGGGMDGAEEDTGRQLKSAQREVGGGKSALGSRERRTGGTGRRY
jgi:hypothetical protein